MNWNLFLDDERFPPDDGYEWKIARTVWEAIALCEANGCPSYISFDHDLGYKQPAGYYFARYLIDSDLDEPGYIPDNFSWYVHSQNPIGKMNIERLLENYMKRRDT